jgi:hypothetical protein
MITVSIHAPNGVHDPNWKDFDVEVNEAATIKDVKSKLQKYFTSGYHCCDNYQFTDLKGSILNDDAKVISLADAKVIATRREPNNVKFKITQADGLRPTKGKREDAEQQGDAEQGDAEQEDAEQEYAEQKEVGCAGSPWYWVLYILLLVFLVVIAYMLYY